MGPEKITSRGVPLRRLPPLGAAPLARHSRLGVAHRAPVLQSRCFALVVNFDLTGHVEDVVVDSSTRGTGLGKLMVNRLSDMAIEAGCYKIILNCVAACIKTARIPSL